MWARDPARGKCFFWRKGSGSGNMGAGSGEEEVFPGRQVPDVEMSYLLPHPHLHSGWVEDQAMLTEQEHIVIIRFGHDWEDIHEAIPDPPSPCRHLLTADARAHRMKAIKRALSGSAAVETAGSATAKIESCSSAPSPPPPVLHREHSGSRLVSSFRE